MAIIDKTDIQQIEIVLYFLFYYKIICNVVYCNICTNAICSTLHIFGKKWNHPPEWKS